MSGYKSGAGSRVSARSLSTELLSEIASSKQQRAQAHTGINVTYKRRGGETSHDPGQYAIARQQDRVSLAILLKVLRGLGPPLTFKNMQIHLSCRKGILKIH